MKLKLCMEEINKGNEVIVRYKYHKCSENRLQEENESKKLKLKQKN